MNILLKKALRVIGVFIAAVTLFLCLLVFLLRLFSFPYELARKHYFNWNWGYIRFKNNIELNWSLTDWALPLSFDLSCDYLIFIRFLFISLIIPKTKNSFFNFCLILFFLISLFVGYFYYNSNAFDLVFIPKK